MEEDYLAQLYRMVVGPCPECGNGRVKAVSDGERTNVLCPACGACWHGGRDRITRVDPATCPKCESQSTCLLALGGERAGTPAA